jgi:cytoplasmic iron level regulating protein YaaA (DUF328/UPF0246 family)
VLIVLPPSEAKRLPTSGVHLAAASLSFAKELGVPRAEVWKRLISLASGPKKRASSTLGLTPGLADELVRDSNLESALCGPAIEIYVGVLYGALDWATLSTTAKIRGESGLLIISALFGALRPVDLIPAYRLSMQVKLPNVGALGTYWKKYLAQPLDAVESELVIDMRSQTYLRAWTPNPVHTAHVRVFAEKSGKRSIVTHMAKFTRGQITRSLLNLPKSPKSIGELSALLGADYQIEVIEPKSANEPFFLDVILRG